MKFDSIEKVDEYLANIPQFQSEGGVAADFNLERFHQCCQALGNPHHHFRAVHVAGTNGKGSTCQLLGAVYKEAGYTTGVYTSPHIIRFNERFKINGNMIPDDSLIYFFQQYHPLFLKYQLTFFEISTALAFWWFAKKEVDVAVIETGLGGRLDATNILDPLVSIITSVSMDHTDLLGNSMEAISREKAGIIKAQTPVVIGAVPQISENLFQETAKEKGSPLHTIEDLSPRFVAPGIYELTEGGNKKTIESPMVAPVQALNLAIVWRTIQVLKEELPVGIEQYLKAMEAPELSTGRFSRLTEARHWYFDGAHNIEAIKALKQAIQTVGSVRNAILVLALMRDKIQPEVMREFSEFKKIYYYPLDFKRSATFKEIKQWLPDANLFPHGQNQQTLFFKDLDSELVIFAGSFYFYTTVQDWIKNCA